MPCTYPLADIQAQMTTVAAMNLTLQASSDILSIKGMRFADALIVVQSLTENDFNKTDPSKLNAGYMLDIYKPSYKGIQLYVKFGWLPKTKEFNVVSFKEK